MGWVRVVLKKPPEPHQYWCGSGKPLQRMLLDIHFRRLAKQADDVCSTQNTTVSEKCSNAVLVICIWGGQHTRQYTPAAPAHTPVVPMTHLSFGAAPYLPTVMLTATCMPNESATQLSVLMTTNIHSSMLHTYMLAHNSSVCAHRLTDHSDSQSRYAACCPECRHPCARHGCAPESEEKRRADPPGGW